MRLALTRGAHELVLTADGYETLTHRLEPFSGEQAALLKLERKPGALSLSTEPPGALITLDGQALELRTPTVLGDLAADRPHKIELSFDGYEPTALTIEVVAGQRGTKHVMLVPVAPPPVEAPQ